MKGKASWESPSVDRLSNSDILTVNNIQIICRRCNTTKLDRTMEEFVDYCKMVAKKFNPEKLP
jgi:hypothetical protein